MVRGFDAESRREQLLSCATEAFSANGYEAARTADIAERAGVSERLLYKHFTGKKELFLAVATEIAARIAARYRQMITDDVPFAAGVRQQFEFRFRGPDAPGATQPLFFGRTFGPFDDPIMDETLGRATRQMVDACAEYFASRAERGELRPDVDPTAAAWTLGAIFRDHHSLRGAYGTKRAAALADQVIQQFIDGIAASPASAPTRTRTTRRRSP